MEYRKGVVITGKNTMAVSDHCPIPEEPCPTGAFIKPLIWSPCTSDAHLCAARILRRRTFWVRQWGMKCAA